MGGGWKGQTAQFGCHLQGAAADAVTSEQRQQVCVRGRGAGVKEGWGGETGGRVGPQLPYLARSLLVGGGVGEGEAENSPGCSGMSASMGGVGGCTLGGVDKDLRVDDDPLRDTQEVSITLTPMLQWDRDAQPIKSKGVFVCV